MNFKLLLSGCIIIIIALQTSCSTYQNATYFKDVPDSLNAANVAVTLSKFTDPKILPNDLLYITIQTLDPQSHNNLTGVNNNAGIYSAQASSSLTPGQTNIPGYMVDKNGNVELPLVGALHIGGMTITEAKELIRKKSAIYYKDPIVNVRYANFNIIVLGEVDKPAQYTVPTERVTLLDAIGMAGDLTIYGKRENVLLIREENGMKKFVRFNLNNSDFMSSPHFYLKQNDVIYIEPNKAKVASNDAVRDRNTGYIISIATSLITLTILLITRI